MMNLLLKRNKIAQLSWNSGRFNLLKGRILIFMKSKWQQERSPPCVWLAVVFHGKKEVVQFTFKVKARIVFPFSFSAKNV
jgi:hypothetical protein